MHFEHQPDSLQFFTGVLGMVMSVALWVVYALKLVKLV